MNSPMADTMRIVELESQLGHARRAATALRNGLLDVIAHLEDDDYDVAMAVAKRIAGQDDAT